MLGMKQSKHQAVRRFAIHGDSGAILFAVVVVMLVGFVIAATALAAVSFTVRANVDNRSNTQAFIAAESGRDAVVAKLTGGCSSVSQLSAASGQPQYAATAYPVSTDAQVVTSTLPSPACPAADTDYVLIESTGTGPNGDTVTIQSVYRWSATFSTVPGGVVTYFSGNVSQGVSHYTGDMVLRNGNWSCTVGGTLDGDLYVLSGTVAMSNDCTIKGDIWAAKSVSGNSTGWNVTANTRTGAHGDITTNSFVNFSSNGDPSIDGRISAKERIDLVAGGGGTATVGGTVTSSVAANVDTTAWTTGTRSSTGPAPTFIPPLDWLLQATKWLDLNNTSGWGTITPGDCSKLQNSGTASPYVTGLVGAGTTPLVLDFTGCTKPVDIQLTASAKLTRDVTIIVPSGQRMLVDLAGTLSDGAHQLFLVHSDASLTDTDADGFPKPTCGNGNQNDSFGTSAIISSDLKVMVYSPCGLTGTVTASFSGQLYTNDTTNFHAGSSYACATMSWPGALEKLGCTIKGEDGVGGDSTLIQKLGARVVQREVTTP